MEMTSQQLLPVDQATAWAALNDIDLLKQSIPGCESLVSTGENAFEVGLLAAVGPVKARFKGRMNIEDANPPDAYTIRFDGQGGAAGFGKGHARVELQPEGSQTLLKYTASAQVGGKIAQIGSRLVDMAAQKMANQFFEKFSAALVERYPQAAAAATAGSSDTAGEPAADTSAGDASAGQADADPSDSGAEAASGKSASWLQRLRGQGRS